MIANTKSTKKKSSSSSASSSSSSSILHLVLVVIIALQWFLFMYLLNHDQQHHHQYHDQAILDGGDHFGHSATTRRSSPVKKEGTIPLLKTDDAAIMGKTGVAATLMLRAPKWFHRRFTFMLQNVLANLPHDWRLQLFVNRQWWESEILTLHPGMSSLLRANGNRIITTYLPQTMTRWKPKQIMASSWLWEQIHAHTVFWFSGNGIICSHHFWSVDQFAHLDFVGVPSRHHRVGGDGSTHSVRSKQSMLDALSYRAYDGSSPEAQYFLTTLQEMNRNKSHPKFYAVANATEQHFFGGGLLKDDDSSEPSAAASPLLTLSSSHTSLVVSGTHATDWTWDERDNFLQVCPEYKVIFPSLHEPNCFGAHPDGPKCAASICALRAEPKKGGC